MDDTIYIPMAQRLREAAAELRKVIANAPTSDEPTRDEASNLPALIERIERYAAALDSCPANDISGGDVAAA